MSGAPKPIPIIGRGLICLYVQESRIDNRTNGILCQHHALSQLPLILRTMVSVHRVQDDIKGVWLS